MRGERDLSQSESIASTLSAADDDGEQDISCGSGNEDESDGECVIRVHICTHFYLLLTSSNHSCYSDFQRARPQSQFSRF